MLKEYIGERERCRLNQEFGENLEFYRNRYKGMSDKEWLRELIVQRCRDMDRMQAKKAAEELAGSMELCEKYLMSIETARQRGISKEKWLEDRLQEAAIGMTPSKYSEILHKAEAVLYKQNHELMEALSRSPDGHIMMDTELDEDTRELTAVRTVELQGYLQGRTIKADVFGTKRANSLDLCIRDIRDGKENICHYQMRFGADAGETVRIIEEDADDSAWQVIVASDQLLEVREYFRLKGSSKTINDHLEINGVRGKAFTREAMQEIRRKTREEGVVSVSDDYYYSTKEYTHSIGKQAGVMAIQMAAVTAGIDMAAEICRSSGIESCGPAEHAWKTGTDAAVKTVTSATLYTAVWNGNLSCLKNPGTQRIAAIAFTGVEHANVLLNIAEGRLSAGKGLNQMGKVIVAMIGGLGCTALAAGSSDGFSLGSPAGVTIGMAAGLAGYAAGNHAGDKIHSAAQKTAQHARALGINAFYAIKLERGKQ